MSKPVTPGMTRVALGLRPGGPGLRPRAPGLQPGSRALAGPTAKGLQWRPPLRPGLQPAPKLRPCPPALRQRPPASAPPAPLLLRPKWPPRPSAAPRPPPAAAAEQEEKPKAEREPDAKEEASGPAAEGKASAGEEASAVEEPPPRPWLDLPAGLTKTQRRRWQRALAVRGRAHAAVSLLPPEAAVLPPDVKEDPLVLESALRSQREAEDRWLESLRKIWRRARKEVRERRQAEDDRWRPWRSYVNAASASSGDRLGPVGRGRAKRAWPRPQGREPRPQALERKPRLQEHEWS